MSVPYLRLTNDDSINSQDDYHPENTMYIKSSYSLLPEVNDCSWKRKTCVSFFFTFCQFYQLEFIKSTNVIDIII